VRVAGIMSGTSLDGIDVAVIDVGRRVSLVAFRSTPYPSAVRKAILEISNADTHTARISRLNFLLAELYAEAFLATCRHARIPKERVKLIGCHGQTIFHEGVPAPFCGRRVASTLQIGNGSVLAERTGVPVIADFRSRDMAAGGQGAPLVPLVDYLLFRHKTRHRVALNIGGIANITFLPAGAGPARVMAFDTGPGNMVMDALVQAATRGSQLFDRGGRLAARGKLQAALLDKLLTSPFYDKRPPKSAGREQYGRKFVEGLIATGLPVEDLLATAAWLSACTIARSVRGLPGVTKRPVDLIVSGGGVHNAFLMRLLTALLPGASVASSSDHGIDPDAKEAMAFGVLAWLTWRGRPGNLPSATGARRPVVLGGLSR